MGKSIEYIKTIPAFKDFFDNKVEMHEENPVDFVIALLERNKELLNYDIDGGVMSWHLSEDVKLKAKYSPKVEYENYFTASIRNDGTLIFFLEAIDRAIAKMISGNIPKKHADKIIAGVPVEVFYSIGNIVMIAEDGDFGTEDKPWMQVRYTAILPFKVDVIPQKRTLVV